MNERVIVCLHNSIGDGKMKLYEKTISSRKVFSGKIVNLRVDKVKLPNNETSTREIVQHPGAVAIVAVTRKENVLLVRQYRKATESVLLELPAGKLEDNETKKECAQRELMEETGHYASDIQYVTSFYTSPGFTNELLHLFFARDLKQKKKAGDEDEFIEIEQVPMDIIVDKINDGTIKDAKTIIGLLLYYTMSKGVIKNELFS